MYQPTETDDDTTDRSLPDVSDEAGLDRRTYLQLVGAGVVTGSMAGVAHGSDGGECQTVPTAIAADDGTVGTAELQTAIRHWAANTEVPGTCGKTVDSTHLIEIVRLWQSGESVDPGADGLPWSDPETWEGSKPQANDTVEITEEMNVVLDESPPELTGITVDGGRLTFARQDLELTTGYIVLKNGGTLQIGTEDDPFEHEATITLTGTRDEADGSARSIDTSVSPASSTPDVTKTITSLGGKLSVHGAVDQPTWTQLDATAAAGDTQITLTESVDWSVGDEVALVSTSLEPDDVDRRTVTAVNGNTIELDEPLDHTHYGELQYFGPNDEYEVDERGEVLNLSRNVVIQGDQQSDDDNFGGHVMAMNEHHEEQMDRADNGEAWPNIWADYENDPELLPQVSGVEFNRMGQEGILARYPFHWHRYGDADGSYIKDCAIHDSYQRGVTIHGTQNATVENNVAFDVTGHCYFLEGKIEDGRPVEDFEHGTLLKNNVGALIKTFSIEDREHLISDAAPAAFWTNGPPKSTVVDNVAAGVYGHGFWVDLDNSADSSHRPRINEELGTWEGNVAHSIHSHDPSDVDKTHIRQNPGHGIPTTGGAGFLIDGGAGDFHGITAYKCVNGFWNDESKNNIVRNSVIADTRNALWYKDGGVDDSVVVAHTDNQTLETEVEQQRGYTLPERGGGSSGADSVTAIAAYYKAARTKNTAYIGFDTDDDVPHGVFGTVFKITTNPYFGGGNRLVDSRPYLPKLPKGDRELEIFPRAIPTADGGFVGEYDGDYSFDEFDGDEYRELRWGAEHLTDWEDCEQIDYIGTLGGYEFDRHVYKSTDRTVRAGFPQGDYEVDGTVYEDIGGKGSFAVTGRTYEYQESLAPGFDSTGATSQITITRGYSGDYVVFVFPMEEKPTLEHVGQPPTGDLVEVDSPEAVQSDEATREIRYHWDDGESKLWLRLVTNPDKTNEFGTLPFKDSLDLPIMGSRNNGVKFR